MSHKQSLYTGAALGALLGAASLTPCPAIAQTSPPANSEVQSLQQQVDQLRQQLQSIEDRAAAARSAAAAQSAATPPDQVAAEAAPSDRPLPRGAIQLGGVRLQLGGFIEAASIYRSRNEVSDVGSDYNTGIVFNNNVMAHEQEFRESARQSRISGLATGDVNDDTHLAAYIETDFLSAAATSNSRESNSYSLRVRHAYTTLDEDAWGFHVLAGQEWSLLTTNTVGIIPRQEQIPLTIDAQYVEGFNWTRNPQLRIVENWGHFWAGLSLESPQGVTSGGIAIPAGVNVQNAGDAGGLENPTTNYTNDLIPDIIAKVAADPGWGHYELKGLARIFTDNFAGTTNAVWGYAGGAAATMPVVPKFVDLQLSGLAGYGIGRYGSGQLPDVAFTRNNSLVAIPEVQALVGVIVHPWMGNDVYLYGGWEHADRAGAPNTSGYGSGSLNDSGCNIFGSANCQAETRDLKQAVAGTWQDVYKGNFGRWVVGLQYSYIERDAFSATIGGSPSQNENIVMTSIRYYPF
jgi:hypothetical protein